jgi:hypothetical protein
MRAGQKVMNVAFYETAAQVIPVLVIALVLQTRVKLLGTVAYWYVKASDIDKASSFLTFMIKYVKGYLYLAFVAEIASLAVVFRGGAPWPVYFLVWPALLGIFLILIAELAASLESSIYRSVEKSMIEETDRLEKEAKRLREDDQSPPSSS